jgi:hypothetical protein
MWTAVKGRLKMSIKATVKRVAAIFDQQKNVQRTNDAGNSAAPSALAAEVVNAHVEQPQEPTVDPASKVEKLPPSFDLSALRRAGKTAAPASAPKIKASVSVPTAAPVIARTPAPVPAEMPAVPTVAAMIPEIVKTLAPIIEKIVRQVLQQQAQPQPVERPTEKIPAAAESTLQDGEIPGSGRPVFVEPTTIVADPQYPTDETPEQTRARLDADLAKAVRDSLQRKHVNPNIAISHSIPTGRDEYRRR